MTADSTAAAPTAAAETEHWGLVRAADWDTHGPQASVSRYRSSSAAGRSAGAQNRHIRRTGLPESELRLVVRSRGDWWDTAWDVVYDPRNPAGGAR